MAARSATKTFAFQRDALPGPVLRRRHAEWHRPSSSRRSGAAVSAIWPCRTPPDQQGTIHYDTEKDKLIRRAAKSAKNGPVNADGSFSFAGIDDQYFAAAFLPSPNTPLQTTTFDDVVPSPFNPANDAYPGVAVGGAARNQFGALRRSQGSLRCCIRSIRNSTASWTGASSASSPSRSFMVLHWHERRFVHNYGWSIILLTIFINVALFPLKIANLKSMRKMQVLQPQMQRSTKSTRASA